MTCTHTRTSTHTSAVLQDPHTLGSRGPVAATQNVRGLHTLAAGAGHTHTGSRCGTHTLAAGAGTGKAGTGCERVRGAQPASQPVRGVCLSVAGAAAGPAGNHLCVALRVPEQAQQELAALLGPAALPDAVPLVLGLAGATHAACTRTCTQPALRQGHPCQMPLRLPARLPARQGPLCNSNCASTFKNFRVVCVYGRGCVCGQGGMWGLGGPALGLRAQLPEGSGVGWVPRDSY